ncbi:leucine-rich repeat extensin-like protein 5 [Musa acuminata AAA Group]|uniref:leucine-rich repeat extensin-like protein 5 n=1 Tax=Musa acuminata AAA Group TaxID=214697 RepID=UPI0031DAA768
MMTSTAPTAVSVGASAPGYPNSVDSSPRSRRGDSLNEPLASSAAAASSRLRVMCSYGGRIVPRPADKSLCYLGGETRMVTVDRGSSFADLSAKLSRDLLGGRPFSLKYQLPNEDLDALISVTTDEDLENMIEELDRISAATAAPTSPGGGGSRRSRRPRLFLFPSNPESAPSSFMGSLLDESKSETWFVDALNTAIGGMGIDGLPCGRSTDSASVVCLLGLEDDSSVHNRSGGGQQPESVQVVLPHRDSSGTLVRHGQNLNSVPGSPMLDKSPSLGSNSSTPSLSNLPSILVTTADPHADHHINGVDDHFAHMNPSTDKEPLHAVRHQPPPPLPLPIASVPTPTIYPTSRDFDDDDDRSNHGGSVLEPPQPTKPGDPVSRLTYLNAISDPKVSFDPTYRVPVPVTGCVSPPTQAEHILQHQQSQPQFIPPNARYIHHPAVGTVLPVPSYYPIAAPPVQQPTPTQPFHPQFRMCYVPLAAAPPNLGDPSSVPPSAKLAVAVPSVPTKPELPVNSYMSAPAPAPAPASLQPQLIRVASNPHAGTGYHVMQQQALLPRTPATSVTYGAEVAATPGHPALYHARAFSRPVVIPQQYQTVCSTAVTRHAAPPGDSNTSGTS